MHKILLVDDDEKFLESLYKMLKFDYEVTKTVSAKDAVNLCGDNKYDLIIVDLYMDEMSGIVFSELVQSLFPPQRIVVLSGTTNVEDKISILEGDVLDYIDKSIEPELLLKRIELMLKKKDPVEKLYSKREDITVDIKNRFVYKGGSRVHLPNKEFNLLVYLISNKNKVLDRESIYQYVWGETLYTSNLRIVDIHVLKLRQKFDLKCLHSERGVGYIWED